MKIKVIAILLMLAMLASALVGCGGDKSDDTDDTTKKPATTSGNDTSGTDDSDSTPGDGTSTPDEDMGVPEGLLALADKGLSDYRIVYPLANEWTKDYADQVADVLFEKTGAQLKVVHDSASGDGEYEIRIGEVKGGRIEVLDVYKNFKANGVTGEMDFAISVEGNTIYVYGTSTQGVASAVDYFLEKVLAFGDTYLYAAIDPAHSTMYVKESTPSIAVTGSDENYVYFSVGQGTLMETFGRVSYTGYGGWRIQTKGRASEPFDDFGAAQRLAYSLGEEDPSVIYPIRVESAGVNGLFTAYEDDTNSYVTFDTENFEISFYDADGDLANSIIDIYASAGGGYIKGTLLENEAIFGTGEKFNTANQRGKTLQMVTKDIWSSDTSCYVVVPLLCLSRGSGIYMNRYEAMTMELDNAKKPTNTWSASILEAQVDCYIYTTDSAAEVIKGYCELTGYAEQPEEWTYGMLLCRFSPDLSQKWSVDINPDNYNYGVSDDGNDANGKETADGRGVGVYDVIAKMEAYDLPWTGILAEPWGAYSGAKHDDLKELCDYTHSLGKKFLVYIAVGGGNLNSASGYGESYLVSQTLPDGTLNYKLPDTQDVYGGNPDNEGTQRYYLDVTNPAAVEWFFNDYWDYLTNEIGVDGCKIDFCELMPETHELNYYDEAIATEGSHHWYPVAFSAKFWEMLQEKPDSGMCYIRGGGIGLQRSPYVWAGDQKRVFDSLELQLSAVLSAGLSGIPFISYDMSGYEYMGGRCWDRNGGTYASSFAWTQDPGRSLAYESQVFLRGLQFTTFTLCMQTHGSVRWAYEFAEDGDVLYDKVVDADGNVSYKPRLDLSGKVVYDTLWQRDGETGKILTDASGKPIPVLDENGKAVTVVPGTYSYVVDVYRAYVKLHELLTPYLSEMSALACEDGIPVMRHLVFGWQSDANVYNIDDEYTLGDAFLVAPVVTGGTTRDIYLPAGEWLDLNTGATYTVGTEGMWLTDYEASVVQLPVFYNLNTTSETAAELLDGIQEIFDYLNEIDAGIPSYLKTVLQ